MAVPAGPNATKQARLRKKKKLRRQAVQLIRKWQLEPWKQQLKSLNEILQLIEATNKLPNIK